jgi:hypothetical protein
MRTEEGDSLTGYMRMAWRDDVYVAQIGASPGYRRKLQLDRAPHNRHSQYLCAQLVYYDGSQLRAPKLTNLLRT